MRRYLGTSLPSHPFHPLLPYSPPSTNSKHVNHVSSAPAQGDHVSLFIRGGYGLAYYGRWAPRLTEVYWAVMDKMRFEGTRTMEIGMLRTGYPEERRNRLR